MKKRVALINPGTMNKYCHKKRGMSDRLFTWFFRKYYHRNFSVPVHSICAAIPPITLYGLEALFQDRCEIVLVDEQTQTLDLDMNVDLVCFTSTTTQYERARYLSGVFRAQGIHTVIGGVHACCVPERCREDFDTVCIGEAEGYIEELIDDFHKGRLKSFYRNTKTIPLEQTPFFNYHISAGNYLPFYVVNFSRGCNYHCEFCSIQSTIGRHRTRPVEALVRAIEKSGARDVWFTDASLTGNIPEAKKLFRALIPLNIEWLSCVSLNICHDDEMLDLMAQSGCWLVSIGFETLKSSNIEQTGKSQNRICDYRNIIRKLHQHRIAIEGNFVFGFDGDTEDVFEETARFTIENGIDLPEYYVLTPYPGTPLYERLLSENRIVDTDWSHYDNTHFYHLPVYEPRNMSREALRTGCRHAEKMTYGFYNTIRRLWHTGMYRPSVCIANWIFMQRILKRDNLFPLGMNMAENLT